MLFIYRKDNNNLIKIFIVIIIRIILSKIITFNLSISAIYKLIWLKKIKNNLLLLKDISLLFFLFLNKI